MYSVIIQEVINGKVSKYERYYETLDAAADAANKFLGDLTEQAIEAPLFERSLITVNTNTGDLESDSLRLAIKNLKTSEETVWVKCKNIDKKKTTSF